MRNPLYELRAPKQASTDIQARKLADTLTAEIRQDLSAVADYTANHGSFSDFVRAHYGCSADAV